MGIKVEEENKIHTNTENETEKLKKEEYKGRKCEWQTRFRNEKGKNRKKFRNDDDRR